MLYYTANPSGDAERHDDAEQARHDHFEAANDAERLTLEQEVRDAILAGNAAAIVPHVSIAGKRMHALITEVLADHMHDQDPALLQLLSCAAMGDIVGAAAAAETIISAVAHRHAEDVCERLELSGEVMA